MNNRDYEERKNFLESLSRRLKSSAKALDDVSRRMEQAKLEQNTLRQELTDSVDAEAEATFTYLEYLEFRNAAEFRRFRHIPPITDEDIADADLDDLIERLQSETNPTA